VGWWGQDGLVASWSGIDDEDSAETTAPELDDASETPTGPSDAPDRSKWEKHFQRAAEAISRGDAPAGKLPPDLPRVLALIGLASPATCALRALARVIRPDGDSEHAVITAAARIGWSFRSLLNRPESIALVRRGRDSAYWRLALEYGWEGCLSSVMDEYLTILEPAAGVSARPKAYAAERIADKAESALRIRAANIDVGQFDVQGPTCRIGKPLSMRSLFAMRLGERVEATEAVRRNQAVGDAFNSPFWPFVLATTSAGQEGLDFHWYCHSVVHWNLPSNPVDLEQREGRVNRFKGHAVRKNVANRFGKAALLSSAIEPWEQMFSLARDSLPTTDRGLLPFWMFPIEHGAWIERCLLLYPFSRDEARYKNLQRSLGAYRMVFGQPRQEELLAYLMNAVDEEQLPELTAALRMNLAPPRIE
jgi:hypothetical protein